MTGKYTIASVTGHEIYHVKNQGVTRREAPSAANDASTKVRVVGVFHNQAIPIIMVAASVRIVIAVQNLWLLS